MIAAAADTPIRRATILDLTLDEAIAHVEELQQRRMRQHTLFEEAQLAKAKLKEQKDRERFDHLINMYKKKSETVDKGIEALSKYLNEMKVLELVCGS